jgi:aerobic carbon-monoxide dehydrogenase medium subunit
MFETVEAFYRPASVREALQLLQSGNGFARIVAGCTDLIVEGDRSVRFLIDISRTGLSYIRRHGANWAIGATTTMAELEESAEIRALAGGLLCRAAATCGSVEIRNMATVGGNMANGSPAADLATPLLALDAVAVVAHATGRRRMPLADYLAVARSREPANSLLVEVTIPDSPHESRCGWSFQKFGRTAVDISVVNAAAGMQLDSRSRVKWVRLALGAVAPAPVRMPAAEAMMVGRTFDHVLLAEVCESVMRDVRPISDIRASAEYRRELSRVLAGRALEECASFAGCSL